MTKSAASFDNRDITSSSKLHIYWAKDTMKASGTGDCLALRCIKGAESQEYLRPRIK